MKFYHFPNQAEDHEIGIPEKFVGEARLEKLIGSPKSPQLRAIIVEFEPNSYTKLHHHTGDQLLYVTEGEGFVEFENGEEVRLEPEARVIIPAGTLHRHGASPEKNLVHLAVTLGETFWWSADRGRP